MGGLHAWYPSVLAAALNFYLERWAVCNQERASAAQHQRCVILNRENVFMMKIRVGPLSYICFCHTGVVLLVLQLINFPSHEGMCGLYPVLSWTTKVWLFIVFCPVLKSHRFMFKRLFIWKKLKYMHLFWYKHGSTLTYTVAVISLLWKPSLIENFNFSTVTAAVRWDMIFISK